MRDVLDIQVTELLKFYLPGEELPAQYLVLSNPAAYLKSINVYLCRQPAIYKVYTVLINSS